jgi:hypothetical protein
MKKSLIAIVLSLISIFSFTQTATLRLQTPDILPKPGEEFLVGVWMDEINYDVPTIKSGQFFIEYDSTVLTIVSQSSGLTQLAFNINQTFKEQNSNFINNSPAPGDIRFLFFSLNPPGYNLTEGGKLPAKLWDIKFVYNGGHTSVKWNKGTQLTPIVPNNEGGKPAKGLTVLTAWDNAKYVLTLKDAIIGQ